MSCGSCGGSSSVNSPLHSSATWAGTRVVAEPYEYEVIYPNGRKETFNDEADAYRAIRLTGGGVRRKAKS